MTPEDDARFAVLNAQIAVLQGQISLALPAIDHTLGQLVDVVKSLTLARLSEMNKPGADVFDEVMSAVEKVQAASAGLRRLREVAGLSRYGS